MSCSKRLSLLLGLAAITTVGSALPAQADVENSKPDAALEIEAIQIVEPSLGLTTFSENVLDESTEAVPAEVSSVEGDTASTSASLLLEPTSDQSAIGGLMAFDAAGIETALNDASIEPSPMSTEGIDIAQSASSPYGGVAPAYLGVGGNIGIFEDGSAIGQFGFAVISKVSLGPRFALRPSFLISEDWTSFTIPLTYNFNTMALGGFRFQPYVGAGVDIPFGNDVGVLIDAGADIPISRDFTLNTAANFRVSGGFNMGLTFGVAYNFPFIFD